MVTVPSNLCMRTLAAARNAAETRTAARVLFVGLALGIVFGAWSDTLDVPAQYTEVQAGIDAAKAGDTVHIGPGRYLGPLSLKEGVRLVGAGRDETVIASEDPRLCALNVKKLQDGALSGITLEGPGAVAEPGEGVVYEAVLRIVNATITVEDCTIRNAAAGGLLIKGTNASTIRNCTIAGNQHHGIAVVGKGAEPRIEDCIITGNGGSGVFCTGPGAKPTLKGLVASGNTYCGIYFEQGTDGVVAGNTCRENGTNGISVETTEAGFQLTDNVCERNHWSGIYLPPALPFTASGNRFADNGIIAEGEVVLLRNQERFEELEALAKRLREEKLRYASGEWQLEFFYNYLSGRCNTSQVPDAEHNIEILQRWCTAYPESVTARIALAKVYDRIAWRHRGSGWAREVTPEGWEAFHKYMDMALKELQAAETFEEKDPHLYAEMVGILRAHSGQSTPSLTDIVRGIMGISQPGSDIDGKFRKGVTIEPTYFPLYCERLEDLLPRWGGSAAEVEEFMSTSADSTAEAMGDGLYAVLADYIMKRCCFNTEPEMSFDRFSIPWERVAKGHRDLLEQFPKSSYRRNWFCRAACLYEKREAARALFEELGEDWDTSVWQQRERFDTYRRWALEDGVYPKPPSPLTMALQGNDTESARKHVAAGAEINFVCDLGYTPLMLAVDRGNLEGVELLLENGADPNQTMWHHVAPLHRAARKGHYRIVKTLLEHGADPNVVDKEGFTPLHKAVLSGTAGVVRLLLEKDVDVNVESKPGGTPLLLAIHFDYLTIVKALLEHGADPNRANKDGNSPMQEARKQKQAALYINLLKTHGANTE